MTKGQSGGRQETRDAHKHVLYTTADGPNASSAQLTKWKSVMRNRAAAARRDRAGHTAASVHGSPACGVSRPSAVLRPAPQRGINTLLRASAT